jgi:hypothetical protein
MLHRAVPMIKAYNAPPFPPLGTSLVPVNNILISPLGGPHLLPRYFQKGGPAPVSGYTARWTWHFLGGATEPQTDGQTHGAGFFLGPCPKWTVGPKKRQWVAPLWLAGHA